MDILSESSSDGLLDTANVLKIIDKAKGKYPKIENWISEFRAECPYHQIEEFARNENGIKRGCRQATPTEREPFQIRRGV